MNQIGVEVEFAVAPKLLVVVKGKANVGSPKEEVAVSEYPPAAVPTRICPKVGDVERPVPPKATESVEVAETTPLMAWRLSERVPMVRFGVVRSPVAEIVVVPVPPTARVFAEKSVVVAPPRKRVSVVVEFPTPWNGYGEAFADVR